MDKFLAFDTIPISTLLPKCTRNYATEHEFRLDLFQQNNPQCKLPRSVIKLYAKRDDEITKEFHRIFHKYPNGIKRMTSIVLLYVGDHIPYFSSLSDKEFDIEFYNTVSCIGPKRWMFIDLQSRLAKRCFENRDFSTWLFSITNLQCREWVVSEMLTQSFLQNCEALFRYAISILPIFLDVRGFMDIFVMNIEYNNKRIVEWSIQFIQTYRLLTRSFLLLMLGTAEIKKQPIEYILGLIPRLGLFRSFDDLINEICKDSEYIRDKEKMIAEIRRM